MMKKLLILLVILAISSVSQAVIFQDTFDHAMGSDWGRLDYEGWWEGRPNGFSIGTWDGYQSLPDPVSGSIMTIAAYNYVPSKNVKYDAPYPLIPYTEDAMAKYWLNDLPSGAYPAPDVYYNWGMGEAGRIPAWQPGYAPDRQVLNGKLVMINSGGGWADDWNTGPFLYKNQVGNFAAYVEIVGRDYWWNNLGGLMARAANPDGIGANENWVYLTHFPVYSVGNHIRNTVMGASTEMGIKGYPAFDFLKLVRQGTKFYFYAGERVPGAEAGGPLVWVDLLPGGIDRPDLPEELQVGIFAANYTADWVGTMEFDNFLLIPEPATITLLGLGGLFLIRRRK